MTEEEYRAAIAKYKEEHSASGSLEHGVWKKHKYIRIENGKYIYPEDEKKSSSVGQKTPVAVGGRLTNPEYESHRDRTDSYQTTESYQEEAKKLAETRAAGRKATQEYKSSGQHDKDVADEKAKIEKQKQAEANKKAFEESTKQLSPQERYKKEQAENKAAERKETDQKQVEADRYKPIKPENMTNDQLDAFKEMSREHMEGMEYSAKKYKQDNNRPTKVVVTKYDPYTGAPVAAKVTYIDNNGHEQDTGYFFKDLSEAATLENLQRRIDSKKKVQHSYADPKSFYAAIYDYKQAHKR